LSNVVYRWRRALCDSELSSSARLVGWAMSMDMQADGGGARPGGTRLAKFSGLSVRTVRSALSELTSTGYLLVTEQGGTRPGERKASAYQAAFPVSTSGNPRTGESLAPVKPLHQSGGATGAAVAHQSVNPPLDTSPSDGTTPMSPVDNIRSIREAMPR